MSTSRLVLLALGALMGGVHDWQCYRKAVNEAKAKNLEKPLFDYLCFILHLAQGSSAGMVLGAFKE